jgi:hypothetical protein
VIAEAKNLKAICFDDRATSRVSCLLAVGKMLAAIKFDYQFGSVAHEVGDIVSDWHLSSETCSDQAMVAKL